MVLRNSDYMGTATLDGALQLAQESASGAFAEERQGFAALIERIRDNTARFDDTYPSW